MLDESLPLGMRYKGKFGASDEWAFFRRASPVSELCLYLSNGFRTVEKNLPGALSTLTNLTINLPDRAENHCAFLAPDIPVLNGTALAQEF
jgi:hypothetical protein